MKDKFCNHKDHEAWSRRSFVKALGFTGAGTMALGGTGITFAQQSKLNAAIDAAESEDRILIIIQLFGGNDGLNMIVPINQYDEYANARPTLRIDQADTWSLSDEYGMNKQMESLERVWGEGSMKIVHSVGYDNHIKSHFKGTDIFSSAQIEEYDSGWLGRHFQEIYPDYATNPPEAPTAIQIGSTSNVTFEGSNDATYSFTVANVSRLETIANTGLNYPLTGLPDCTYGEQLKFVRGMVNSTYNYADKIHQAYERSTDYTADGGYPQDNQFASSLGIISRLIKGNLGTKVYMFSVSGFDTHSDQITDHPILLKDLADAVAYFQKDLADAGWDDKVLSMSVSEFGRRVFENASNGTDHGTSYPVMFFGSGLNGSGFVGEHASIKTNELINERYMEHTTDFRSVYATVLKEWLCVDSSVVDNVILQGSYNNIDLGISCSGTAPTNPPIENPNDPISSSVYIQDQKSYIRMENNATQHIVITLYNVVGQRIGVIANDFYSVGVYDIDVTSAIGQRLSAGAYIYEISSNSGTSSKVIPVGR